MKWNVGRILALLMAVESLSAAVGFFLAGEKKTALYWLFAAGINATFVF